MGQVLPVPGGRGSPAQAMGQVLPVPGSRRPPAQAFPDHLIEEILVRIATPRDLVCASAACASFRRIVADASFLRRYRTLHPSQLLLGILNPLGFLLAEAPHPNALVADALDRGADFSPNIIPPFRSSSWFAFDLRDGRVLWTSFDPADDTVPPELAVTDPLTRGYTLLPRIPENLIASLLGPIRAEHVENFYAFFVPSGDYEEEHFRLIGWTFDKDTAVVFVYSSLSGTWTAGTRAVWDELGLDVYLGEYIKIPPYDWRPSYAYRCFYWKVPNSSKLLKLDVNRMEFSAVGLPPNHVERDVVVAEAGEGRFGIVSLSFGQETLQSLRCSIGQNEGEIADEHPMETTIPLPSDYGKYKFVAAADGYIFIQGKRYIHQQGFPCGRISALFLALEMETLKVERFCSILGCAWDYVLPYFGFPPFMSPRRI